ncbi:hypothetical protein [Daejeonella lutea]|uniref:Uncharacterized protein n=1 Tax=Daejeonella lutea TaxID=572036 RepID=A0A1T5FAN3_9SPHI|nr:hypothetical protein [Daejeonella lutea]SKB93210.1 hypothetical protein SAMN05661099_3550 [Daejeonella lutea]
MKIKSLQFIFCYAVLIYGTLTLNACKGIPRETEVFSSDFERGVPVNVINGKVEQYNGGGVLGRYSEGGFNVEVRGMKDHDMIKITFDLYIHDTWDGNAAGPDGKDIWIMNIDGGSNVYASFANGTCNNCTQSYPELQPPFFNGTFNFALNRPNSNAIKTDLPGACKLKDVKGGTSMYRIQRTFHHTSSSLDLGCFAGLEDPDKANKSCNESWSVDNMRITAIDTRE